MSSRILFFGYGNPGRCDDGLGPVAAEHVERLRIPGVTVDSDYQLTVEDSAALADFDVVCFADASVDGPEPFGFSSLEPGEANVAFSSHHVSPDGLLALADKLFSSKPKAYMLSIRGYRFNEFLEELSPEAEKNLTCAVEYFKDFAANCAAGTG
jgi:hydrogenase maturation protease